MQEATIAKDTQFRDAADCSDSMNPKGRGGRGRGRFSRNWRENKGNSEQADDDGLRGRGRGRRGGKGRGARNIKEGGEEGQYDSERSYEVEESPAGRFDDIQEGGKQSWQRRGRGVGRGRGRGRGGHHYDPEGEASGENAPNSNYNSEPFRRVDTEEKQENVKAQGRFAPESREAEFRDGSMNYHSEGGQDGSREYIPRRGFNQGRDAAPYRRGKQLGSEAGEGERQMGAADDTSEGFSPPAQTASSAAKPLQRRQRAPHLRHNSRNEEEVLALFEHHHKQKGITLDNYGNIPVEMVPRDIEPVELFSALNVAPALAENIERCGYKSPTPVQRFGIPVALQGNDLMACAQTGSGKTAAFLIPIVNYILIAGVSPAKGGPSKPIGIVLAPTRELALQIFDEARKITFRTDIFCDVVYGGTAYPSRFENDLLVACPGRLTDMFGRRLVSFSEIKFLVLDEADRMLEMGFEEQIEHLVSSRYSDMPSSEDRQTLMFSATFPQRILNLAKRYLRKHYYLLTVGRVGSTTKNITQIIERIENEDKIDRLFQLIYEHKKTDLVLIFVETKKAAEDLHRELNRENIPSATIHGDRRQQDRESALASFKSGETPILVATDVASRGLDIPDVSHVIQFDLPSEMDDYTHRIGRTARAGNKGTATAFYNKNNRKICVELYKYFCEHDQHIPTWFKEEAEHIEGEALLTRGVGGNQRNKRRTAEENQGTWGDSCAPRAPRANAPQKKRVFVDDGGF